MSLTRSSGPLSGSAPETVNYRIDGPAHKLLMHVFPRRAAPAARTNHDDVTLSWSGPRRCHIVVVARDSAL